MFRSFTPLRSVRDWPAPKIRGFRPLRPPRWTASTWKIRLLGPFQHVTSIEQVVVGRHGLLIEHKGRRGLLLPQVAAEYRWTADVFLEQTCGKAGLPFDSWSRGAILYRFEAEVFGNR
jgi:uncharacterized protein (TIGR00296 family)